MTVKGQIVPLGARPAMVARGFESVFKNYKVTLGGVAPDADPVTDADALAYAWAYDCIMPHAQQAVGASTSPFTQAQRAAMRALNSRLMFVGYFWEGTNTSYDPGDPNDYSVLDATGLDGSALTCNLVAAPETVNASTPWLGGTNRHLVVMGRGTPNEEWFDVSRSTNSATLTLKHRDMDATGPKVHAGSTVLSITTTIGTAFTFAAGALTTAAHAGKWIVGPGIPAGTTIQSVNSGAGTGVLSNAATAAATVTAGVNGERVEFFRAPHDWGEYADEARTVLSAVGANGTRPLDLSREDVQRYCVLVGCGLRTIDPAIDPAELWDAVLYDTTAFDTLASLTNAPYQPAKRSAGVETGTTGRFAGWAGADWTRLRRNAISRARLWMRAHGVPTQVWANCLGDGTRATGFRDDTYTSDGVAFAQGYRQLDYCRALDGTWMEQAYGGQKDRDMQIAASPAPADGNWISTVVVKRHLNAFMEAERNDRGFVIQHEHWPDLFGTNGSVLSGHGTSTFTVNAAGTRITVASGTFRFKGAPSNLHPQPGEGVFDGLQVYVWRGDNATDASGNTNGKGYDSALMSAVAADGTYCDLATPVRTSASGRTIGNGAGAPQLYFGASVKTSKRRYAYGWGLFLLAAGGRCAYQQRDDNITLPDSFGPARAGQIVDGVMGLVDWKANRQVQRPTNHYWRTIANVTLANGSDIIVVPAGSITARDVGAEIVGGVAATFTTGTCTAATGIPHRQLNANVPTTITEIVSATQVRLSRACTAAGTISVAVAPRFNFGLGESWLEKIRRGFEVPLETFGTSDAAEIPGFPGVFARKFSHGVVIVNTTATAANLVGTYALPAGTYYQLGDVSLPDDDTSYTPNNLTVPARTGLLLRTVR